MHHLVNYLSGKKNERNIPATLFDVSRRQTPKKVAPEENSSGAFEINESYTRLLLIRLGSTRSLFT